MQKYSLPYIKVDRAILHSVESTFERDEELLDTLHSEYTEDALLSLGLSCIREGGTRENGTWQDTKNTKKETK